MRVLRAVVSILVLLSGSAILANPSAAPVRPRVRLRIGLVAFTRPVIGDASPNRTPSSIEQQLRYLQAVARASREPSAPGPMYEFETYVGNYYQILAWLRSGDLDGAFVSSFTSMVLEDFNHGDFMRVLELMPYDEEVHGPGAGRRPLIAAHVHGSPSSDPVADFTHYIELAWRAAASPDEPSAAMKELQDYDVELVAHLSSTGFISPLAFVEQVLIRRRALSGSEPGQDERFWRTFFQGVRLRLRHGALRFDRNRKQIFFTYDGRSKRSLERDRLEAGSPPNGQPVLSPWVNLAVYINKDYLCPNDALVIRNKPRQDWSMDELNPHALWRSSNPWKQAARVTFPGGWNGDAEKSAARFSSDDQPDYFAAGAPDEKVAATFEEAVNHLLLADTALLKLFARWYVANDYDFRATEVIELLRQDQENRGVADAALVLPGGGVKGAYQARLLDLLYDGWLIANTNDDGRRSRAGDALQISHVIGTSGGAMVGFFAAQRSLPPKPFTPSMEDVIAEGRHRPIAFLSFLRRMSGDALAATRRHYGKLTQLWITDMDEVLARPSTIFPPADLPRWVTVWVIVLLFSLIVHPTISYLRNNYDVPAVDLALPARSPAKSAKLLILAVLVLTPLVARAVAQSTPNYVALWEGVAYTLVIGVGHYVYTCSGIGHGQGSGDRRWARRSTVLGAAIVFCLLTNFFAQQNIADLSACTKFSTDTFWTIAGLLFLVAGMLLLMRSTHGLTAPDVRLAYLSAMLNLAAVVTGAFFFVWLAGELGLASTLELTVNYWLAVGAGTVFTTLVLIIFAFQPKTSGMRRAVGAGLCFWVAPQPKRLLSSPLRGLLVVSGLALLLWGLIAAPGLYSGCRAYSTFSEMQQRFNGTKSNDYRFLADLLVTTTSFETQQTQDAIYQGDYYCCSDSSSGCRALKQSRGNVLWFKKERFPSAVFASGSPFPIFPARALQPAEESQSIEFIDGGYAHNVPLEGAEIAGAQQVLLIRSAARPEPQQTAGAPNPWVSRLALGSINLVPFLFERSQEIDRGASGRMVVASLAPDPDRGAPPFLMDFRESTVRGLVNGAAIDFLRGRIGRMEAWGLPRLYSHIE